MSLPNTLVAGTNWFKYLLVNASADDTYITTATVLTTTEPSSLIRMVEPNGHRYRGIEIMQFGTNAADETVVHYVNHITRVTEYKQHPADTQFNEDPARTTQWWVRPITAISTVLKEQAADDGVAGAFMLAADFTGDAITQSRTTFGTALEAAFGQTSVLNSPGSDVLGASYFLPDVGNAEFIQLGYDQTTSATGNALVRLFA